MDSAVIFGLFAAGYAAYKLLGSDSSAGSVGAVALPDLSTLPSGLAWGALAQKKYGNGFIAKVIEIARELECDPSFLLAIMKAESGITYDIVNPASNATGFIQFTGRDNIAQLGRKFGDPNLTAAKLKAMGPIEQLAWVKNYFLQFKKRLGKNPSLYDMYSATFWPASIGKPMDYVYFTKESKPKTYAVNTSADRNSDGTVTRGEAMAKIGKILLQGYKKGNVLK